MAEIALKPFLSRRISRDALDGVPHEKFIRIVGVFNAVVPPEEKARKDGVYQNPLAQEFERLREMIESKLAQNDTVFQRDEMGDHVHNLNLLLGELLPASTLESALPALRDEYRTRVGVEIYSAYMMSPGYKGLEGCDRARLPESRLRLLRADYLQLINEIRKMTLLEYHIEETRSFLIRKLRRTLLKLLAVPLGVVLIFIFCRAAIIDVEQSLQTAPASVVTVGTGENSVPWRLYLSAEAAAESAKPAVEPQKAWPISLFATRYLMVAGNSTGTALYKALVMATLLSLAAIAGALGSFISALLRIAAVPETTQIARNVVALRYSESIRLAPVTGFVFAVLLSFIFGGQLLNGNLFPNTTTTPMWAFLLFSPGDLAKWLVWSFIVGFVERLMPDMIDRMVANADKTAPASTPLPVNGAKEPSGLNGAGGQDRDGETPVPPLSRPHRVKRARPAPAPAAG